MAAANRALLRADAYCQNNKSCPFNSQGKRSVPKVSRPTVAAQILIVVQAFQKVLASAEEKPLAAPVCNSTSCISPVTRSSIQQGLYNSFLSELDFPGIFSSLEQALQGNASLLAMFAADPIPDVSYVWSMPLLCSDNSEPYLVL
jgi:hypothetical protein